MSARPTAAPAPRIRRAAAVVAMALAGTTIWSHAAERAAAQGENEVVIEFRSDGLTMRAVAVRPGGTVRWVNRDSVAHNTTHLPPAGEPSRWNSYEIPPGESFVQRFPQLGAWRYFDFYDPEDPTFTS
jgi:plastocyanin